MSLININAQTIKKTNTAGKKETANQTIKNKKGDSKDSEQAKKVAKTNSKESTKSDKSKTSTKSNKVTEKPLAEKPNLFDESLRKDAADSITKDDIVGEDLEVRNAALNALGKEAGTVVVIEPQSGKILAIVNQDWAIRKTFKPCSTIKLVTGIAAIKENAIDNKGNIKNYDFPMDLTDALAYSNNSYFQLAGTNLGQRKFYSYARALGLGETTGINAENEASGKIPDYKFGSEINRSYSHGDEFEVTAIQLATLVSTITNGGKVVVPQIPKEQTENASFIGYMKRELDFPKEVLQSVLPGMIGAVNYGTAQKSFEPTLNIAGKTGSCIADGTWIGLFASVSSAINPKLAIVVITKGSKARGSKSAEIASKVYSSLAYRLRENPDFIAKEVYSIPAPKVSPKVSDQLDVAKSEDSDEKTSESNARKSYQNIKASFKKVPKTTNNNYSTDSLPTNTPANTPPNPPVTTIRSSIRPRIVSTKN